MFKIRKSLLLDQPFANIRPILIFGWSRLTFHRTALGVFCDLLRSRVGKLTNLDSPR